VIVDGVAMHSVIGRRIWETWHITRHLLESRDPNIHDLIWEVILNRGDGPLVEFEKFDATVFEDRIKTFPKVVLKFD
jgi:threonine 3-dehydrogenase